MEATTEVIGVKRRARKLPT